MSARSWSLLFLVCSLGIIAARKQSLLGLLLCLAITFLGAVIRKENFCVPIFFIGLLLLAYGYYSWRVPGIPAISSGRSVALEGTAQEVRTNPEKESGSLILYTAETDPYLQKVQVFFYYKSEVDNGDHIKVSGSIDPPEPPRNPGTFDYPRYLADQHIFYVMSLSDKDSLQIIKKSPKKLLASFKEKGEKNIKTLLPEREADVLLGMLFGKRDEIDDEMYLEFQKTGIVHLFAVSGLHIGFIVLLCTWLFELFPASSNIRFGGTALIIILYGTLIGWPISVRRAAIMAFLAMLALYYGRERKLMNTLGLAGIIILIINPADLFRISFQLSFLATWGIISLYPALKKRLKAESRLMDIILLPLGAQLATWPLVAYYFYLFTPVAILANILVTYLAGAVVMLGFAGLLLTPAPAFLAAFFFYPAGLFIEIIYKLVAFLQLVPGGSIWVAAPPLWSLVIYYAVLAGTVLIWERGAMNHRYELSAGFILLLFTGWLLLPAGVFNRGQMEVTFLDVGQGDCIIIKTPRGKFIMVDGGGSEFSDIGKKRVLPYMHYKGIRTLEWLINTHPDTDHLQGVEAAAREMRVKFIGVPFCVMDSAAYNELKAAARQNNIRYYGLREGQSWQVDDCLLQVLSPAPAPYSGDDFNDQSLVLRVSYRDFSVLLTGDIGSGIMQKLEADQQLAKTTVVKVPHHGSKNSYYPAFYRQVGPEFAVIQLAKNNRFGHPHPSIINLLEQMNIPVLRNDLDGAVMMESDGYNLETRAFLRR